MDNEYLIMSEVSENEKVTQRELSKKLGVSVSTVNVLINKMIREGLIKMTQVSQKQVLYMLTPVGMMEKAQKTARYLKGHYRAIFETKEKIKSVLDKFHQYNDVIYVLICNDEMGEILTLAVHEFMSNHRKSRVIPIHNKNEIDSNNYKSPMLLHMNVDENVMKEYKDIADMEIINFFA